jgi:glucosylceramidase
MKKVLFNHLSIACLFACTLITSEACSKKGGGSGGAAITPAPPTDTTSNNPPVISDVAFWLTKSNQAALLKKQNIAINFTTASNSYSTITVDTTQHYQSIDGFGFTLTGGSAYVINHNLSATDRSALIRELFSNDSTAIGISYLRISIGASDLDRFVFSYDDLDAGQTDVNLDKFSLKNDEADLIPLLKDILAINPTIKIVATPWSPPSWMKDNNNTKGGTLKPEYYTVYANYLVKYIQAMKAEGITIDAITPQNEPQNPYNNPSMVLSADQEASFIRTALGPAFKATGIASKIIIWDHNCDMPQYPAAILSDADAKQYIDGSAFHLYAGDISALGTVHDAYPDKNIYFTEQYTASDGNFGGDLKWHVKNVIIGSMRNWSRNALEWNLANDPNFAPHTDGGCTTCKGALTVSSSITRNVSYYIIAHASRFVTPGSVRVSSNITGSLNNVAFKRPDGKVVLIVENDSDASATFNISFNNKKATATLDGGSVGTFVW